MTLKSRIKALESENRTLKETLKGFGVQADNPWHWTTLAHGLGAAIKSPSTKQSND